MTKRKRCMSSVLAVVAVLAAGAVWCLGRQAQPPATQPVTALRTWAVLASDELRKSGLEDQILAGLGTDRTITLVDREHLALVAKELALSSLLETSGAASRRKAGAAIRADALAILHLESAGGESFVRLVICETGAGARLAVECFPYKADHADEGGKAIVAAIERTRRRFRNGVQRVYAVPPMVSKDLGHQYDYLQRGCASLLAGALASRNGVAVVEIDEARQIARELGLTDGADIRRFVPLLIEGEYEVTRGSAGKEATIRFAVKVTGNGKPVTVPDRTVALTEMAGYLSKDLAAAILGSLAPDDKPLSAEQEAAGLVAHALVFSRLGAWEHSTGLREAALLLADDPNQRKALVEEYLRMVKAALPPGMGIGHGVGYRELCTRRWVLWRQGLAHLEYLVRNDQADGVWAPNFAAAFFEAADREIRMSPPDQLAAAEAVRRRFLREMYAPMEHLTRKRTWGFWHFMYDNLSRRRIDRYRLGKEDLDFLYDMMVNVIPADDHHRQAFLYYPSDFEGTYRRFECTASEFAAFLDRLEASDRPENQLAVRVTRLHFQWNKAEHSDDPLEPLLEQAKAVQADFDAHPEVARACQDMRDRVRDLRRSIEDAMRHRKVAARPVDSSSYSPKPPDESDRPIRLHTIDFKVRDAAGKLSDLKGRRWKTRPASGVSGAMRLLNCGSFDVIWHEGVVLLHRTKGILDEAVVDPNATFGNVEWDGRIIWLADRRGNIRILTPDGREICRVTDKHGMPACDQGLLLHPLGEGKAVAIGSFGPHCRLWCGVVDVGGGEPKVTLFHQATRVRTSEDPGHDGPDMAAKPYWTHEHQWTRDGHKVLLVGRSLGAPLEIDLSTLTVSVSKATVFSYNGWHMISHDGYLVETMNHNPVLVAPPGKQFEDGKNYRYLGKIFAAGAPSPVLPYRGRLYVPGYPWFRIEPGTWKVDALECQRLPINSTCAHWGVSAHYGFVAWGVSDNPWYQGVIVDEESSEGKAGKTDQADRAAVKQPAAAASNQ